MRTGPSSALVLVAGLALAGCGSSNSEADKTADFIGTWNASGTFTAECPPLLAKTTQPLDKFQQVVTKGTDSDLVTTTMFANCSLKMDVNGNLATVKSGQTCTVSVMGFQAMGTFTSGTFTVTGDTGTFSYAGTGNLAGVSCTFSAMGTTAKSAGDAGATSPADAGATD
jgi:hypothetical protein